MKTFKQNKPVQDIKPLKRKSHWKLWLIFGIFLMTLIAMAGYGVKSFFDKYYIISPIQTRLQSPLPDPVASSSAKIKPRKEAFRVEITEPVYAESNYKTQQIVDTIFTLESSRGKNDGCRDQGLYNGYGYRQNSFEHICFSTQEEVIGYVTNWVDDKVSKGFSTAELLCYYNQGLRVQDCPYYQNFLTLVK